MERKELEALDKITTRDIIEHYEHLLRVASLNKFNTLNDNNKKTREEVKKFLEVEWKLKVDVIQGPNIELNGDMLFYCIKCDTAPIDVEKDKDGFYICKECKCFASVVDKDEQEK